jgi:hypothetical protein
MATSSAFLDENGVEYDANLFELQFLPPQNFTKYRQIELDAQQAQVYTQLMGVKVLSERWKLKRYLNMTDDELLENEQMWVEENSDKFEQTTGQTPADAEPEGDLGSVGIRPPDDFGMPTDEPMPDDMNPDGNPEGMSDAHLALPLRAMALLRLEALDQWLALLLRRQEWGDQEVKLVEFVKAEDATNYDPNKDTMNRREKDDTRKPELTLKALNQLKKLRALKKLEALRRQNVLALIYGANEEQMGGGMGF